MALRVESIDNKLEIHNEIGLNPNGFEMSNGINVIMVLCDRLYVYHNRNSKPIYESDLNKNFSVVVRGSMVFESDVQYDKFMMKQVIIIMIMIAIITLGFVGLVYYTSH